MNILLTILILISAFQQGFNNRLLALKERSKKNPDSTIQVLNEILTKDYLDEIEKAEYVYLLGRSYDKQGKDTLALNNYLSAAVIFEENGDKEKWVKSLYRIGVFYAIRHKVVFSEFYFNRCITLYRELGNVKRLSAMKIALCNLLYEAGKLTDAKKAYKELYSDSIISNSISYLADLDNNLANTYKDLKEYDSALLIYQSAISKYSFRHDTSRLIGSYHNIGFLFLKMRRYDSAIYFLTQSLGLAKQLEDMNSVKKAYFQFSEIQKERLNFKKAYDLYRTYDSLENIENNAIVKSQLNELQTKYETEKKDQEIKIQKAELDLTNAEKERLMYILLISLGFTVIIIYIYSQRQKAVKNLRKKESELHTQEVGKLIQEQELKSINSMLEGEEKERKRIAEDLHDRVGSMLSAMKLQSDPANEKMVGLLDETAEEVRRISHNLETQVLNRFGLAAALEDLADKIKSSGKIEFELHHLNLDERLDNKVEINTYRIVQELISNALKHSQATSITTQVNLVDDQLIIMVEDNGVGFDSIAIKDKVGGMGLNNVASRANELNGSFNVDSNKGHGTVVTVEISI